MSHVESVTTIIRNLAALRDAAAELQGVFTEATTYHWYGRHVGDYPLPPGIKKEDLGKCEYKISFPGIRYEIGVKALPGGGYTLLYDFYGSGGEHDGQKLLARCGKGLGDLLQRYEHQAIKRSLGSSRRVFRVTSSEEARRLSQKLGQKIHYTGKMLTICTA